MSEGNNTSAAEEGTESAPRIPRISDDQTRATNPLQHILLSDSVQLTDASPNPAGNNHSFIHPLAILLGHHLGPGGPLVVEKRLQCGLCPQVSDPVGQGRWDNGHGFSLIFEGKSSVRNVISVYESAGRQDPL